jgi:hypothetical protein
MHMYTATTPAAVAAAVAAALISGEAVAPISAAAAVAVAATWMEGQGGGTSATSVAGYQEHPPITHTLLH